MKQRTSHHAWIIEWNYSGKNYPRPSRRPMILSARLDGKDIRCILSALWVNNPHLYYFEKPPFIRYKGKKEIPIHSAGPRLEVLDRPYLAAYRVEDLQITPLFDKGCEVITWTEPAHRVFDERTKVFVLTGSPQNLAGIIKYSNSFTLKITNISQFKRISPFLINASLTGLRSNL